MNKGNSNNMKVVPFNFPPIPLRNAGLDGMFMMQMIIKSNLQVLEGTIRF